MRSDAIPVKTSAGLSEIIWGDSQLSAQARTMLIAVCGDLTVHELRQRLHDMVEADSALEYLQDLGLIECLHRDDHAPKEGEALSSEQRARALMAEIAAVAPGLDSYLFTLRVRACTTHEQLCALLPAYHDLLASAVGENLALMQSARVGLLLASP